MNWIVRRVERIRKRKGEAYEEEEGLGRNLARSLGTAW